MTIERCRYCGSVFPDHIAAVRSSGFCGNAAVLRKPSGHEPIERPALRIVHNPDTGCGITSTSGCPFHSRDGWYCKLDEHLRDTYPGLNAPPWCQLRAGDVVVSAGKDGG